MMGKLIVLLFISFKLFFLVLFYAAGDLLIFILTVKITLYQKKLFRGFDLLAIYWVIPVGDDFSIRCGHHYGWKRRAAPVYGQCDLSDRCTISG